MKQFFLCFYAGVLLLGSFTQAQSISDSEALTKARALLKNFPLIDGHNDLPWVIRADDEAPMDVEAYDLRKKTKGDTDIDRLRSGGVGAQFWSVYIPSNLTTGFAKAQLEQIDIALRMIELYPDVFELAATADEIEKIFSKGKIASVLGIEGGKAIENSPAAIRIFYRLGVRYMTLTHSGTTDWADACTDTARHGGLSPLGENLIREMNRTGMLIDLSHVSDATMSDALNISQAPVIFSHSSVRALANHVRNVPDSILLRIPKNGGIVMVTVIPNFTSEEKRIWEDKLSAHLKGIKDRAERNKAREAYIRKHPEPKATLKQVADHIDYIKNKIGADYVGIGADYFGEADVAEGMEDVSKYPYLFAELIKRGWSDADLKKLAGGNILRVLRQAEDTAKELQNSTKAMIK
ncbi:MAG: dipeptidase [Ignavibacteriales bacterium]